MADETTSPDTIETPETPVSEPAPSDPGVSEPVASEPIASEPVASDPPPPPPEKKRRERKEPKEVQETPAPAPAGEAVPTSGGAKLWYVVKVQSGREESIKDAIERRVKIEGLQESYGEIIIPTEKVTEMRNNKRVVKERKLYPGYLMVNVDFNDRILYLFRETSGVGDFVGAGLNKPPLPMTDREVERMLGQRGQPGDEPKKVQHKFDKGHRVKVRDGTFAGLEGEIKEIMDEKGTIRVELTIFGRPVSVELEYWQIDHA